MNIDLIKQFEILHNYYKTIKDKGRTIAYSKAITSLRLVDFKIVNIQQLSDIRNIGKKIIDKIKEYLDTGKIDEVEKIKGFEKDKNILETIWGIGPVKAEKLKKMGIDTIEKLKKHENLLTKGQKIGLRYYEDLATPVARDKITVLYMIIVLFLNKHFGKDTYKIAIAGSYRRGAKQSGDIDCLISSDKFNLREVVDLLIEKRIITDTLSIRNEKFMGIVHCPSGGQHIRLDIEFVPKTEWGSALLYFTGSKNFNMYIRSLAKKSGMTLNEHGLYHIYSGKRVLYSPSEKDILEKLGLRYVFPENR